MPKQNIIWKAIDCNPNSPHDGSVVSSWLAIRADDAGSSPSRGVTRLLCDLCPPPPLPIDNDQRIKFRLKPSSTVCVPHFVRHDEPRRRPTTAPVTSAQDLQKHVIITNDS